MSRDPVPTAHGSAKESPPDVSAVVINYHSADLALECVRSIFEQEFAGAAGKGSVETVVVDNASPPEDRSRLDELPPEVVRIDSDRNLGYGGAANAGFARARGRYLCLLNPDIVVLPGAFDTMLEHLREHADVGAVGPRTFMDLGRRIQHPLNRLPSLRGMIAQACAFRSNAAVRRASLTSTRYSCRYWRTEEPLDIEMLSGACIMIPRTTLDVVGGFDEDYPLYYEDADWCRRIGAAGFRMRYVPTSTIVHYYNMSAGKDPEAARAKREASRSVYWRKVFGRVGAALAQRLDRSGERRMARIAAAPPWDFEVLGAVSEPPRFELPAGWSGAIAEFAGTPFFEYAAAMLVDEASFDFPADIFAHMPPTEVFVRLVEPRTFEIGPAWRFRRG